MAPSAYSSEVPQLQYPVPLDAARGAAISPPSTNGATYDIETPILVVGGGPVGMLQSLMLARLHQVPSVLIERELTTTAFPKMEYTNGRSMEIYRKMGLSEEFRAMANKYVPDSAVHDELIVTGMVGDNAKLVHTWKRPSADEMRRISREMNDGARYLEPHLRCHQIPVEKWLQSVVQRESEMIESHWGWQFLALEEQTDGVISEIRTADGKTVRIKSQYVIGSDGGGSWVRKSVGLESKRNYLELSVAFVHFRSKALRESIPFGPFWHANAIGGGIIVSQNENDLFTCHWMLPPDGDANSMSAEDIIATAIGGCSGPHHLKIDEVLCRGIWRCDVAVATSLQSARGRVFLTGDAAHQLSPVGGHGLNSGLADTFDLAWKLSAKLKGWGSDKLLRTYDTDRRAVAYRNVRAVQDAIENVVPPVFMTPMQLHGPELLLSDSPAGEAARKQSAEATEPGHWLHNQNGNILGYQYQDPDTVITDQETTEPPVSDKEVYRPTTYPGSRAPHVWMKNAKVSTLDKLAADGFTLLDFTGGSRGGVAETFEGAAKELGVPLKVEDWYGEEHVRGIYERDVVLVRPDMHVTWRIGGQGGGGGGSVSREEAKRVLERAVGR